jgi:hypothetical protein
MKKFVCEQNTAHFQKLLGETADAGLQRTLQALLSSAKRELAILNSTLSGADVLPFQDRRRRLVDAQAVKQQFQSEFDNSPHPYMLLDPGIEAFGLNGFVIGPATAAMFVVAWDIFSASRQRNDDAIA